MRQSRLIGKGISPADGDPNSTENDERIPSRAFYTATLFVFFTGGVYFVWLSIWGINTVFYEGYPQLGTMLPGQLLSSRYNANVYWWMILLLSWNGLAPMILAMALTYNRIREWGQAHQFVCIWLIVLNIIVLGTLTFLWIGWTNTAYSGYATSGNDYRWCCVFWPSEWCPNNAACVFSSPLSLDSSSQLARNEEMTAHWAFTFVFLLLAFWNLQFSENLRKNYRVLASF